MKKLRLWGIALSTVAGVMMLNAGSLSHHDEKKTLKELHDRNNEKLSSPSDHLLFTNSSKLFNSFSNGIPTIEMLNIDCKYLELINDYLVFNLKSLNDLKKNEEENKSCSSGTCFVTSPMNDSSCEFIYLVTAAHCVVNRDGNAKSRIVLIPKRKEGMISNRTLNHQLSSLSETAAAGPEGMNSASINCDLIECQIVCCEYDGDRDVDFAILKCNRSEFLKKNGFTSDDDDGDARAIPHQYFIPTTKRQVVERGRDQIIPSSLINNVIVGYPSKYKEYRDERVRQISFETMNRLMMTFQKKPVFSFGRYLRTEEREKTNISIYTNTINKGMSGGPSCDLSNNIRNGNIWPKFNGIVTLFDKDGYGSFDVSNEEFRKAYSKHIPSSNTDPLVKKLIDEFVQNK